MKTSILFIGLLFACVLANSQEKIDMPKAGGGSEGFENCNAGDSYGNGSFVGNNSITWTYNHSRDVDTFPITGKGLMLRRGSDSYLQSSEISGGISSFEVKMKKAYTGARERKLELYINGNLIETSQGFGGVAGGDATTYTFSVEDINIPNNFTIKLKPAGTETNNQQIVIDDIVWTEYASTEPYIAITSPANNSTIYSSNVDIVFSNANFDLGTAGKVKYTVNGGTPEYTTTSPISLISLTDGSYNVVLELVDNSNASLNPQVTASVNFTVNTSGPTITSIHDIQYTTAADGESPLKGQQVWVRGIVYANFNGTSFGNKGYFIHDAAGEWSGIYIYDLERTPVIGNTVLIQGTVDEYFGLTQLKTVTHYEVVDPTTEPYDPIVLTTETAKQEKYESCFIKINDAQCKSDGVQDYGLWIINDGSGDLLCKRMNDDGFTPVLNTRYNVTGALTYDRDMNSNAAFNLLYRSTSDVTVAGINSEYAEKIKIYPNPAVETINIDLPEKADRITVLNNIGQVVIKMDNVKENQSVNVKSLNSGTYFIKVEKGTDVAVLKFIIN